MAAVNQDAWIDIIRFLPRRDAEKMQLCSRFMNFTITNARRTLPRRPISNIATVVESLRFLLRSDLDNVQIACAFLNRIVVASVNDLARRHIARVAISETPDSVAVPLQITVQQSAPSIRQRRGFMPVHVRDQDEAVIRLHSAYIEHFVVWRMPQLATQQILAAIQTAARFNTGTFYFGSYLCSPAALLNSVQCKHLQWYTVSPAYVKDMGALLVRCARNGPTSIDFERVFGQNVKSSATITDECVVTFVTECATRGSCALHSYYSGNFSADFLSKLVQRLNVGPSVATLCLVVRAPNQQQNITGGVRRGTDGDWTMRIDALQLNVAWTSGQLRITKNHAPGQHCSCLS